MPTHGGQTTPPARLGAEFCQDLRYAARTLARRPVFTTIAVLSIAPPTAALSAAYGLMHDLLFRPPIGIQEADRVVALYLDRLDSPEPDYNAFTYPQLQQLESLTSESVGIRATSGVGPAGRDA